MSIGLCKVLHKKTTFADAFETRIWVNAPHKCLKSYVYNALCYLMTQRPQNPKGRTSKAVRLGFECTAGCITCMTCQVCQCKDLNVISIIDCLLRNYHLKPSAKHASNASRLATNTSTSSQLPLRNLSFSVLKRNRTKEN